MFIVNFTNVAYLENYDSLSRSEFYMIMIFTLISNFPLNFYAIMTIKNIDFKLYMCYIFLGNQMVDDLQGSSIFLFGCPNIIYEDNSLDINSDDLSASLNPKFNRNLSQSLQNGSFGYASDSAIYVSKTFIESTEKVETLHTK